MSYLGDAISVARRAKGITQEELAESAAITQAALSRYENDLRDPSPEVVAKLAEALGVTPRLLNRSQRLVGAMAADAHMRRRATAGARDWRRLEARLNMYRLHTHQLMDEIALRAEQTIPSVDPIEVDPGDAARLTRMQWRLPVGPVRDLTGWLEAAGCIVIEEDFGTTRVDGLSQWIDAHPLMLINSRMPTDRKRLTLAHELGHLIMHSKEFTPDPEADANQFAAEFLMPAEVIKPQLRSLTLGKLHDLKRLWAVSMQALIERAFHLKMLPAADRTKLYKQLGARGWRRTEPLSHELPSEQPKLPAQIGEALQRQGLSDIEIAQIAGFAAPSPQNPFQPMDQRRLRVV